MKLTTQYRGPVTLSKIDYAANLSEETYAFTAVVSIVVDGKLLSTSVDNDGRGGPNTVRGVFVDEALKAYCATLPKETSRWGTELNMDPDYLISSMVGDAIAANALKKMITKKTAFVTVANTLYTIKGSPTEDIRRHIAAKHPGARILNDMGFAEARALFEGIA